MPGSVSIQDLLGRMYTDFAGDRGCETGPTAVETIGGWPAGTIQFTCRVAGDLADAGLRGAGFVAPEAIAGTGRMMPRPSRIPRRSRVRLDRIACDAAGDRHDPGLRAGRSLPLHRRRVRPDGRAGRAQPQRPHR